jgi:DNA-binding CsgD family transcriptional regulator
LWQSCEGAITPIVQYGTKTASLTAREREVATLAAHGSSSREIADQLFLSNRTVENYLQRVYEKLSVNTRAALKELLGRP